MLSKQSVLIVVKLDALDQAEDLGDFDENNSCKIVMAISEKAWLVGFLPTCRTLMFKGRDSHLVRTDVGGTVVQVTEMCYNVYERKVLQNTAWLSGEP